MSTERFIESFRIGRHALRVVLPRDQTTTDTHGTHTMLPNTIFNWTFRGLKRTDLVPEENTLAELIRWVEMCSNLGIRATLLLSPSDRICSDEQLEDLQQETGVDLIWVNPGWKTTDAQAETGEWTEEAVVSLPDESVVDAYYSQAGDCPISVWSLQREHEFWIAYGAAIRTWQTSGSFHWHECADMWRRRSSRPDSIMVPPRSYWLSETESDFSEVAIAAGLASGEQLGSHRGVPFVFNVKRGHEWIEYGRLPGLKITFDIAVAQARLKNELMQFLATIPAHFYSWLASQRLHYMRRPGEGGVSTESRSLGVPLVIIKSNHDAFEEEQDFGELLLEGERWIVRIPSWQSEITPEALTLEFLGFVDKTTGRPPSKTAQPSEVELYHFDFLLRIGDHQEASDIDQSGLFRLSSSTLDVLLGARPADTK